MPIGLATISIKNLRLRTFIGFNPEEKEKQQDIVINVEMSYDALAAAQTDNVKSALDYKVITKAIIQYVEGNRFQLLEKLVGDVLNICCESDAVEHACVTIDKPHALRFADSVALSMSYQKSQNQ